MPQNNELTPEKLNQLTKRSYQDWKEKLEHQIHQKLLDRAVNKHSFQAYFLDYDNDANKIIIDYLNGHHIRHYVDNTLTGGIIAFWNDDCPNLIGLRYDEFADYHPTNPSKTVAISFVSDQDKKADLNGYNQVLKAYSRYDAVLPIAADDIEKPEKDCEIFTKEDAKKLINFVNEHHDHNVIVHCNSGVSRTGAVIHFLTENYHYLITGRDEFAPNQYILKLLNQTVKEV